MNDKSIKEVYSLTCLVQLHVDVSVAGTEAECGWLQSVSVNEQLQNEYELHSGAKTSPNFLEKLELDLIDLEPNLINLRGVT